MTSQLTLPERPAAPGLARGEQPVVLADIMQAGVRVAVWDRPSPVDDALVARACARRLAIKSWVDTALLDPTLRRLLPAAGREDRARSRHAGRNHQGQSLSSHSSPT